MIYDETQYFGRLVFFLAPMFSGHGCRNIQCIG